MRKKQSSLTAAGIAIVRAVESERPADERILYDPYAYQFVPSWMFHAFGFFIKIGYAEWRGPGINGFLVVRDRYIDDVPQGFLNEGYLFHWKECRASRGWWLWDCDWLDIRSNYENGCFS